MKIKALAKVAKTLVKKGVKVAKKAKAKKCVKRACKSCTDICKGC